MALPLSPTPRSQTSQPTFQNFIDGQWSESVTGETFTSINPAHTQEVVGHFQKSSVVDLDRAVAAAHRAQRGWANTPAPARGEVLMRAALLLEQYEDEFAKIMTREMGKTLKETHGDVQRAIDVARFMAGEGRRAEGETVPSALSDRFDLTVRHPHGVVGIITPWNIPLAIPAWKTFPALLAGNAIVLKPASDTPLITLKLAELLHEAGLPAGVFNVITGPGGTLGEALIRHKGINMISLTGSTEVGRHVAEVCGFDLRRCTLELGGKNAAIVLADANLDVAVNSVIWGAFGTTGQRCTATSRVIVQKSVLPEFTERLVAATERLRIGDGLDPNVQMGPLVNVGRIKAVHAYTESGLEEGATLVTGGGPLDTDVFKDGAFYKPTIFTDVAPTMKIAREEVFGPFMALLPVSTYEEAIQVANDTEYGLSTSIFTNDVRLTFRAIRDIETGLIMFNNASTESEIHMPFGGMKTSGNGHRELGRKAVEEFSEIKSVFISYPA
jgi:acyl-CoA reductase-like NAD-dependent aldehyde dehydrogenase